MACGPRAVHALMEMRESERESERDFGELDF